MPKATVTLKHLHHRNEHQIGLYFSYNTRLIKVVKKIGGAKRARINKRVYPHKLRRSIASHHIAQGINLRYVQEWLGHVRSKTSERYTHVAENNFKNYKNPVDDFDI